jgi:hypothetical protein
VRIKLFLIFYLILLVSFGQKKEKQTAMNVTGTYRFEGKTYQKGEDTYGYFGSIRVKQLEKNKIAVSFFICKGAKSYSSGSFLDTLELKESSAVYKTDCDSNCTILFKFTNNGVATIHKDADGDYNFSCCFGHAVIANGFFRKQSSKIPVIKDPNTYDDRY